MKSATKFNVNTMTKKERYDQYLRLRSNDIQGYVKRGEAITARENLQSFSPNKKNGADSLMTSVSRGNRAHSKNLHN